MLAAGAVLDALVVAGALHEDAPHRQRGRGKEVAAAIPLCAAIARDAQIRFVDERGRLQCLMRLSLAGEPGPRELPQFVIHFRQQLAGGAAGLGITWGRYAERRQL